MSTKEIIKNYEKIAKENIKDFQEIKNSRSDEVSGEAYKKVLRKTARILAATLPLPLLTACAACEKPPVVEEQQQEEEEKAEVTIPSEAKEETKETQEITPETTIEEEIVEEIVNATEIPGAIFDPKTGDYTAKAENDWGAEEGEIIGHYVVKGLKVETADGVEVEEDVIGLVPKVIGAIQNKKIEETKESYLPIPVNLKEVKGVKITELKIAPGNFAGVINLGLNVPIGTVIYAPKSSEWELSFLRDFYGGETNDKTFYDSCKIDEDTDWQYYMQFSEGKVIADLDGVVETYIAEENGEVKTILLDVYKVNLGEPILKITGKAFLDETANRISNLIYSYENPGDYQFYFGGFLTFREGDLKPTKILELGKESEKIKVFILPDSQELPNEQAN